MDKKKIGLISFPRIDNNEGNLSFFQNNDQIPFIIKRVHWIYDIPGGELRGGHAFKKQNEVIIALSGSFDVVLNVGNEEKRFHLNRSYTGLWVPNKTWRSMENFSTNSVALIISDQNYDTNDYIRDFSEFSQLINNDYNSF